ncbi:MAG: ATP-dependent DNA helicase RecG, partial [Nitrospirales bacterium]
RQFRRILQGLYELYGQDIQEVLPDSLLNELQLPSLKTAVSTLHFPQETHNVLHLNEGTIPAHQRMAFEELLLLQLALTVRRHMVKTESGGIAFSLANVLSRRFQNLLPFELTSSQKRVIQEIEKDMAGLTSMNRLLQGDVGSGKTLVALHAMVLACGSGYQAALLVPTEVLSEQHFLTVEPYFSQLGLTVVWVKGAQSARERAKVLGQLASGQAQVAVGTHALLQPEVVFSNLGLVVVDEQHKFGVIQRAQLRKKSTHPPNVLVMTATPIPRTLAMTVYGDLDVSVIDQSPPGRKPVRTLLFCEDEREKAYGLLRKEVNAGRQVYIVYPLVERSEKIDLQAAVQAGERLQREEFPEFMVGLLHGRMKSKEKQAVMTAFKAGHIHILVATTVIEVGVDVSNATVILIEHPERFGLAQLHQLRGRVGRGAEQAYCLLLRSAKKLDAHESLSSGNPELPLTLSHNNRNEGEDVELLRNIRQESHRLRVFTQCADGFSLAKADLKIRGPGNILGEKQWGTIEFRVADLIRDHNLLVEARQMAKKLLAKDPQLNSRELEPLRAAMLRKWGETFELGSIG